MKRLAVCFAFFLLSTAVAFECKATDYASGKEISGFETYEDKDKIFKIIIPNGWSRYESRFDYVGNDDNATGIKLQGPKNNLGVSAKISVIYYRYGGFFSSYKEYISLVQNSPTREEIPKKEHYRYIVIDGRRGVWFDIKSFELVFEESIHNQPDTGADYKFVPPYKKVPTSEEYVIVGAKKGFFVFSYEAPIDIKKECAPIFKKIIDSAKFQSNEPWNK